MSVAWVGKRFDPLWAVSGEVALVLGLLLFAALWLPIVVWQYRRYGATNLRRLLGAAAVSVYGMALISYTLLPLPASDAAACRRATHGPQLVPFLWIAQSRDLHEGVFATLTSRTVLQVAFNVVLFVPWGVLLRGYLGRSLLTATLTGGAASLLIELTQGTAIWGAYSCTFRLADVDDLIANTAGALLGALIAPAVMRWMPGGGQLAQGRLDPRPVTLRRRYASMLLDAVAAIVLQGAVLLVLRLALIGGGIEPTSTTDYVISLVGAIVSTLLVFVIPAVRGQGSFGLGVVYLAPRWPDGRGGAGRSLLRASVVGLPWLLSYAVPGPWTDGLLIVAVVASVLSVLPSGGARGLSCRVAGCELADQRAPEPGTAQAESVRA